MRNQMPSQAMGAMPPTPAAFHNTSFPRPQRDSIAAPAPSGHGYNEQRTQHPLLMLGVEFGVESCIVHGRDSR
jgi:hypothetical protein